MDESEQFESSEVDSVEFQLVNGHDVRIAVGEFWEKLDPGGSRYGFPKKLFAIRVYCSEGTLPFRHKLVHSLKDEREFTRSSVPEIFEALRQHISSNDYREHDELYDFLEWFLEMVEEKWGIPEDTVELMERSRARRSQFGERWNALRDGEKEEDVD
jgi:hypothetical protein